MSPLRLCSELSQALEQVMPPFWAPVSCIYKIRTLEPGSELTNNFLSKYPLPEPVANKANHPGFLRLSLNTVFQAATSQ